VDPIDVPPVDAARADPIAYQGAERTYQDLRLTVPGGWVCRRISIGGYGGTAVSSMVVIHLTVVGCSRRADPGCARPLSTRRGRTIPHPL